MLYSYPECTITPSKELYLDHVKELRLTRQDFHMTGGYVRYVEINLPALRVVRVEGFRLMTATRTSPVQIRCEKPYVLVQTVVPMGQMTFGQYETMYQLNRPASKAIYVIPPQQVSLESRISATHPILFPLGTSGGDTTLPVVLLQDPRASHGPILIIVSEIESFSWLRRCWARSAKS